MTRPTLEVADILRVQGDRFLQRYRSSFDFQQLKALRAIQRCRAAAPPPWVAIAISARAAVIRPSPTTRVAIATAPSVRRKLVSAGSQHGNTISSTQLFP